MGSGTDLERARQRLDIAFDLARAGSYRTGTAEMVELAAAEQAYRQARTRHRGPGRAQDQPS